MVALYPSWRAALCLCLCLKLQGGPEQAQLPVHLAEQGVSGKWLLAWGWGISLELSGVCSGARDFFVSCLLLPALVRGQQVIAWRQSLPLSCLFTCWCLPVKFAGCSKNSCVNGFGGVIRTCYTRARRKGEECFIFGWELFNFTGRTVLFKAVWIEHCFQHCSYSNRRGTAPMNFDLQLWEMKCHLIALDCA